MRHIKLLHAAESKNIFTDALPFGRVKNKFLLLISDIIAICAALAATLILRYPNISLLPSLFLRHLFDFSIIFVIWILVFYLGDLYNYKKFQNKQWFLTALVGAVFLALCLSMSLFYFVIGLDELAQLINLIVFSVIFCIFSFYLRILALPYIVNSANITIILGATPLISSTISFIKDNPLIGFRVAKWIPDATENTLDELLTLMGKTDSRFLVVDGNNFNDKALLSVLKNHSSLEISIMNFNNFYEVIFEKEPIDELTENWFKEHISGQHPVYDIIKRILDFVIALIIIIIFCIPFLLIALFIKLSSNGPVIYSQTRVGKNDVPFTLYKFRSMREDAEQNGPQWSGHNDERVTKIGKLLRRTHLDELPQAWNILCGDISLVGPRPERPEFTETLSKEIPYYNKRHIIRPGITGHAQINYRYGASIEDAKEKLTYDIYYIKHRSIIIDKLILLKTLKMIFVKHV